MSFLRMLAVAFALLPLLAAEEVVSRETACFFTEQRGQETLLHVRNLKTFPITVTVDLEKLENLEADVPSPRTETIEGGASMRLFTLSPCNPSLPTNYFYRFHWVPGALQARHDESFVYALPYAAGKSFLVIQGFRSSFSHFGDNEFAIDWEMPVGTPVHAARGGIVAGVEERYAEGGPDKAYRDFANYVMIRHRDGTIGEYAHLRQHGVRVKAGDKVNVGDPIGYSGDVGFSSCPHLHFFVYRAVDGRRRESFPIRFHTKEERFATLEAGRIYTAISIRRRRP
jgi:murein DD-endopeptidase MepM/ murein hydrolase activator NlpD